MRAGTVMGVAAVALAVAVAGAVTLGAAPQQQMMRLASGGPRLGIEIRDVTKDDVTAMKLGAQQGVVISAVTPGSAAEKAGLKAGDVVVSYDGETVRSAAQLTRLVGETAPGRAVKVAVMRDGRRVEIEATPSAAPAAGDNVFIFENGQPLAGDVERQLGDLRGRLNQYRFQQRVPAPPPAPAPAPAPMPAPGDGPLRFKMERAPGAGGVFEWFGQDGGPFEMLMGPARGRLGVTVQELTPELATYFGVKAGVLVASVTADSPAAKAGVKAGDVITAVDDKPVASSGDLVKIIGEKAGDAGATVTLAITRDRKPVTLKAAIEAVKAPGRRVVAQGRPA